MNIPIIERTSKKSKKNVKAPPRVEDDAQGQDLETNVGETTPKETSDAGML